MQRALSKDHWAGLPRGGYTTRVLPQEEIGSNSPRRKQSLPEEEGLVG